MRIAVDMDDVVVDFIGGLLKAVKTEYGEEIDVDSIVDWDLKPILNPIIDRKGGWWKWLQDREWLWANFTVIDGAIGAIDQLRFRDGHWVEMVTSKPVWAEHNVFKWLGKWRPSFQRVTIVKVEDKKADFTDADVLIDDKPSHCADFIASGRKAILFTAAHNRTMKTPDGVVRAGSWKEVLAAIKEMDNGG